MPPILIVDDSATVRYLLRTLLARAGYAVREARDGEEALPILRTSRQPLVVLLDFEMPTINGWQLLQIVETTGAPLTDHAFIVLSAATARLPAAFRELLQRRAIPVLPIPCDPSTLLTTVSTMATRLPLPPQVYRPSPRDSRPIGY
jgi:CheY-like chemotaxis protein